MECAWKFKIFESIVWNYCETVRAVLNRLWSIRRFGNVDKEAAPDWLSDDNLIGHEISNVDYWS